MKDRPGDGLLIIERILRDRDSMWRQIIEERDLRRLIGQMLASSVVSLACYGVVLGASSGWAQALSSMVKLPLLFLATLAICLPTLYLFNLVFGARLSLMQAVTLILISITVTAVLALAFAPISLFFLISAHSYSLYKLLNVAILVLTAVVGLRFLIVGMRALNQHQTQSAEVGERRASGVATDAHGNGLIEERIEQAEPVPAGSVPIAVPGSGTESSAGTSVALAQPAVRQVSLLQPDRRPLTRPEDGSHSMILLYIWILLFGFVGTQLAWTLRPFFGSPGRPFAFFRQISGTFYADIFSTIGRLLSGG